MNLRKILVLSGVSLLELLIVLLIIAILATIAIVNYHPLIQRVRDAF
jgi:prepilin-type N-terminal cleavage/methylation domain-containing protein